MVIVLVQEVHWVSLAVTRVELQLTTSLHSGAQISIFSLLLHLFTIEFFQSLSSLNLATLQTQSDQIANILQNPENDIPIQDIRKFQQCRIHVHTPKLHIDYRIRNWRKTTN
ncbi:uncharacterized protein LOC132030520 [Lycium ferocissimum]|uniref:uncharacterized protein LOC132030520 n=1 Tax=Lycium ferocissimum TaxID=112874 RepID=UPI00281625C3|nr:uncharacterized protein LOC132030520 [Lycium ferocissimum]